MNLKKPKFWDYKKPNFLALILFPLAFLLQKLNHLFRNNDQKKFKIKTICIGNIYIGGTGKTSLCIQINKILNKKNIKSCFVKKFYKNQIDEQKLLSENGKLFLTKTRKEGIEQAEKENYEVAILDDGLQDLSIKYDQNLVCFNDLNFMGNGMTIPAGPLRENFSNLNKYDHVFLNGNLENVESLKDEIKFINSKIQIHLGKYIPINLNKLNETDKYLVFSGIGNHKTFISMIKNNKLNVLEDIEFPDHYNYKNDDLDKILSRSKKLNCKILTTKKDYLRIDKKYTDEINFIDVELNIIDQNKFIKAII